jgi:hypothetical protein
VPKRMRADPLGDLRRLRCLDDDAMQVPRADWLRRMLTREQPASCVHHALLPTNLPPLAQQGQQICRKNGIPIPTTLPRSTLSNMRSLSTSVTLSAATSATRRPAP